MPGENARRVPRDGTAAAGITQWLLNMDWKTRHRYMRVTKCLPRKGDLVRQIKNRMSPCELIDGTATGVSSKVYHGIIPLHNKKLKHRRQTTLYEFFVKKRRF